MAAQSAPTPIAPNVMVVGGTHGNERNAPWLLEFWRSQPQALASQGLGLTLVLGNPGAHAANRRYLERDLNRSFDPALGAGASCGQAELVRARELVDRFGPAGLEPCSVALDLHSTTSGMGNSLVVYGRRPADLALAAGIQGQLGLPIYLHEADGAQTGFLVERWPCGLVIEVGPVPQGVLKSQICRQTQLAVEAALAVLADAADGVLRLPNQRWFTAIWSAWICPAMATAHLRAASTPSAMGGIGSRWGPAKRCLWMPAAKPWPMPPLQGWSMRWCGRCSSMKRPTGKRALP